MNIESLSCPKSHVAASYRLFGEMFHSPCREKPNSFGRSSIVLTYWLRSRCGLHRQRLSRWAVDLLWNWLFPLIQLLCLWSRAGIRWGSLRLRRAVSNMPGLRLCMCMRCLRLPWIDRAC